MERFLLPCFSTQALLKPFRSPALLQQSHSLLEPAAAAAAEAVAAALKWLSAAR
jgi:hypothetical protein